MKRIHSSTRNNFGSGDADSGSGIPSKLVKKADKTPPPVIGIDIGDSTCSVGVFQNGRVKIITNDQDENRFPSLVSFDPTTEYLLIGDEAKRAAFTNPKNTIYGITRLIGKTLQDPQIQADIKYWPFKITKDDTDTKLKIQVEYKGESKTYFPQEIYAIILKRLKEIAEAYLDQTVQDAVITVPPSYNMLQRQMIKNVAGLVGLNVVRILDVSAAAALALAFLKYDYRVEEKKSERNVLTFDLGGGHLAVCISTIEDGIIEIKSVASHSHLGGQDFTNRLTAHFVHEFQSKYNKDLGGNELAMVRLRSACETAKRNLSTQLIANIELDLLLDSIDFSTSITRASFEELNADLFRAATLEPIEKALGDAKMTKAQIHDIILLGGSSAIPRIQNLIQDFFNGKELIVSKLQQEAVVYGAAIEAGILGDDDDKGIEDLLLLDVFEGEHAMTKDNTMLGSFILNGIQLAARAMRTRSRRNGTEIEITFDMSVNHDLIVTAIEKKNSSNEIKMTIPTPTTTDQKDDDDVQQEDDSDHNGVSQALVPIPIPHHHHHHPHH